MKGFFSVYVFEISFVSVQNYIYVMLAALEQFNFCYFIKMYKELPSFQLYMELFNFH